MSSQILPRFLGSIEANNDEYNVEFTQTDENQQAIYFTLRTKTTITLPQTKYDDPQLHCTFTPADSPDASDLHFLGFQASEFALPVRASSTALDFNLFNRPKFTRPASVFPLFIFHRPTATCLLLAPVNAFHEQVLAIHGQTLRWGWSGDLKSVPADFETKLVAIVHSSPREALSVWGKIISARPAGLKDARYACTTMSRLSYWTDNGSAYWYRREKDMSLPDSIVSTVENIEQQLETPIASVELDSWFYRHEVTRNIQEVGYLEVVPPTGMIRWEPREDVLGCGGIEELQNRLGSKSLILHSRHISSKSSYINDNNRHEWWIDADRAHPQTTDLWKTFMKQASTWGATTYEQDWLVEIWQGVRQLREVPGRIKKWQSDFEDIAREEGISLIWCMATPADMAQATALKSIISIRSCDDYRYADDPSTLWRWHLTVSCLLGALGFNPFKDVFLSHGNDSGTVDINGDPNAMFEACLATLSAGPVGIGDRLNRTDASVVKRVCRADGVLIKPDFPLQALDRSLRDDSSLLWADTYSGPWRYITCVRTGVKSKGDDAEAALQECLQLGSDDTDYVIYDWKAQEAWTGNSVSASLRLHEWKLWVICPVLRHSKKSQRFTLIGDHFTFATMGDARICKVPSLDRSTQNDLGDVGLTFEVVGKPGEDVNIAYWSEEAGLGASSIKIPSESRIEGALTIEEVSSSVTINWLGEK